MGDLSDLYNWWEVDGLLTERQKLILKAVVDYYIENAEPIGSRVISKRDDIGFSPATIRNEMADLEELGFLEQPHTSSGRIPSNKGYRYYVDNLIAPDKSEISQDVIENISELFTQQFTEFERVIEQTAQILSQITNYTSIILGPEIYRTKLKHMQIIPLTDDSLVIVLVTSTGKVEHKTVSIPKNISIADIELLVSFLNHKLTNIPLYQLKSKIYTELNKEFERNAKQYEQLMAIVDQIFSEEADQSDSKIYLGGTTNILNQPEFSDISIIKNLFSMFEQSDQVKQLVKTNNKGIEVKIGSENSLEAASNCSIITATYEVDGVPLGTIGIFGPTRMDYSRVIGILDSLTKDFSKYITRVYK